MRLRRSINNIDPVSLLIGGALACVLWFFGFIYMGSEYKEEVAAITTELSEAMVENERLEARLQLCSEIKSALRQGRID
jgi:hypothetical protein